MESNRLVVEYFAPEDFALMGIVHGGLESGAPDPNRVRGDGNPPAIQYG
jgi:hypothetical protein